MNAVVKLEVHNTNNRGQVGIWIDAERLLKARYRERDLVTINQFILLAKLIMDIEITRANFLGGESMSVFVDYRMSDVAAQTVLNFIRDEKFKEVE